MHSDARSDCSSLVILQTKVPQLPDQHVTMCPSATGENYCFCETKRVFMSTASGWTIIIIVVRVLTLMLSQVVP